MWIAAWAWSLLAAPDTPIRFAQAELERNLGDRAGRVTLQIKAGEPKESFEISASARKVVITSPDATGLMYGALEFVERARRLGSRAWSGRFRAQPFLSDRGVNLFLTLPWNIEANDTDYSASALVNPAKWWFHNDGYWHSLFDLMARSRLNWLDIHGMWDISVTDAPNLYAYFVTAPSFPKVGVSPGVKERNLAQLNRIIAMAHARGIRVSLMAYQASLRIPQNPNPPYEPTEDNVYRYTREAVEQMIRRAPGLDAIGFRIGESGRSEEFFRCYGEAVQRSGREIPLITRSWITRRQKVLPLARASKDFTVEIKYNGEQWGAPYLVAGGRMANWYSYSFEDYLSDSQGIVADSAGARSKPAKLWPGNPAEGGGRWPSNPYKIVWQVRANGTHRIFPVFNFELVRSTVRTMKIGTATGYTVEGLDAYYPKDPAYYLANARDRAFDWVHERDALFWMAWGRFGYDPNANLDAIVASAQAPYGRETQKCARQMQRMGLVVPLIFSAHTFGPDHRNHAPEMEWCGDTDTFVHTEPFDTHRFRSAREDAMYSILALQDGRIPTRAVGEFLPSLAHGADGEAERRTEAALSERQRRAVRELSVASRMVAHLAEYFAGRMKSASDVAGIEAASASPGRTTDTLSAFERSVSAWSRLSESEEARFYRPFTERLRMRTNTFHWRDQWPRVRAEFDAVKSLPERTWRDERPRDEGVAKLVPDGIGWERDGEKIRCTYRSSRARRAWLLYKPLPSSTFFHRLPMRRRGTHFVCEIPDRRYGYCIAIEARDRNTAWREPAWDWNAPFAAPYRIVPARPGPTPPIYSSEEALAYLDPSVLDPKRHGILLLAPRGWSFFRRFDANTQRKLLHTVERGMTLLVLQQDYVSGRYPLSWLPRPLRVENNPQPDTFDPAGALGLPKIETRDILWQRFAPSEGWSVHGNGGVAHLRHGAGNIWMVNARLMQRMTHPDCAKALRTLMLVNRREKPVVIVDPGTEDATYSTSCFPDLMNALDVPFLTLGELIAEEQGMNSVRPIPGVPSANDVLHGKGREVAARFLRNRVIRQARRPTSNTREKFEVERVRRRQELFRCLGLQPEPMRVPLEARITGILQRKGYRIEKLAITTHENFVATAHVYVPDPAPTQRMPAIVNVNGHWAHKKSEDRLQLRCAFQALRGYVAVALDSPGRSFEGNSLFERGAEGDHNDWLLAHGGTNATGFYVWDVIRLLDYLQTRPEVDMSRIGITGASGGGLATLYAFAADERLRAAAPVVYLSSLEQAPDNGCLCNHVPGTCQIGDRSDVMAIRAPQPVLIVGAQDDPEFPPGAMLRTGEKVKETWRLFGAEDQIQTLIFPGPHDYSQAMRETVVGFFDLHLRGVGDGSPVSQPPLAIADAEDRALLVFDPPPAQESTMQEIVLRNLSVAPAEVPWPQVVAVNGGWPERSPLQYREWRIGKAHVATFESESGLVTPCVIVAPRGRAKGVVIVVHDLGKVASRNEPLDSEFEGWLQVHLDLIGTGELGPVDLRHATYSGTSLAFTAGWQIVRAAEAFRRVSPRCAIVAQGTYSTLAALYAGSMDPTIERVLARDALRRWEDYALPGVNPLALQPRANLCGSLEHLRSRLRNASWRFIGERSPSVGQASAPEKVADARARYGKNWSSRANGLRRSMTLPVSVPTA